MRRMQIPGLAGKLLAGMALGLASALLHSVAAQVAPSAQEVAGYSGLHAAAYRGDAARIEQLALAKPDLNARDGNGRTPLHVATFARRRDAIRALVKAGADPGLLDKDRYDCVTIAAVADDEETLRVLVSVGASAKLLTSRYDGTALIAAAHLGHDGVVKQLIAAGAPLDHVNNLHWTAVIESIVLGDVGRATSGPCASSSSPARTCSSPTGRATRRCSWPDRAACARWWSCWSRPGHAEAVYWQTLIWRFDGGIAKRIEPILHLPRTQAPQACCKPALAVKHRHGLTSCLGRQIFSSAQTHSQTLFDQARQRRPLAVGKRFGLYKQSVLNVQRDFHKSIVCRLTVLAQRDSYKLSLPHLHHIAADRKLQSLVAYHIRIHPHAATIDQPACITARRGQSGGFKQRANP